MLKLVIKNSIKKFYVKIKYIIKYDARVVQW